MNNIFVIIGSKVLLCDFQREKAWMEWTRKKENGVKCQEKVLILLRAIADSQTNEDFENSTVTLQQHPDWQSNEKLRRFLSKWLCHAEVSALLLCQFYLLSVRMV